MAAVCCCSRRWWHQQTESLFGRGHSKQCSEMRGI